MLYSATRSGGSEIAPHVVGPQRVHAVETRLQHQNLVLICAHAADSQAAARDLKRQGQPVRRDTNVPGAGQAFLAALQRQIGERHACRLRRKTAAAGDDKAVIHRTYRDPELIGIAGLQPTALGHRTLCRIEPS